MIKVRYLVKASFKAIFKGFQIILNFFAKHTGVLYSFERSSSRNEIENFFLLFRPYENGVELIRIGGTHDGGYLVPNDMSEITHCLSPGVGSSWDFETELAERFNISSWMIDDTVTPPQNLNSLLHFNSVRVGLEDEPGRAITLDGWVSKIGVKNSQEFLLQMDIESHEWLALLSTSRETLKRFRILVVEFHSLPLSRIPYILERIYLPTMRKILLDFDVVHVHPNNSVGTFSHFGTPYPDTLEVTFHRKDRARQILISKSSMNQLDNPCDPHLPELSIDHLFQA